MTPFGEWALFRDFCPHSPSIYQRVDISSHKISTIYKASSVLMEATEEARKQQIIEALHELGEALIAV